MKKSSYLEGLNGVLNISVESGQGRPRGRRRPGCCGYNPAVPAAERLVVPADDILDGHADPQLQAVRVKVRRRQHGLSVRSLAIRRNYILDQI